MLSHVDENGKANMVNISDKSPSVRRAFAKGSIFTGDKIFQLIKENQIKKGDVLSVSKIAAIMAAKKTGELIPLCHPLNLNYIDIKFQYNNLTKEILIFSEVAIEAATGVEMEALIAVNIAALTIYDMCKGVDKSLTIGESYLIQKFGGKSGIFRNRERIRGVIQEDSQLYGRVEVKNIQLAGFLPEHLMEGDILEAEGGRNITIASENQKIYTILEDKVNLKKGGGIWLK